MVSKCVFCQIACKELRAFVVYESDAVVSFLDIAPASRGHALVIPKVHAENLFDVGGQAFDAMMKAVHFLAPRMKDVLGCDGLHVIQNNGMSAGQSVFHIHVHLIPRWENDEAVHLWKPGTFKGTQDDFAYLQKQLIHALNQNTGT